MTHGTSIVSIPVEIPQLVVYLLNQEACCSPLLYLASLLPPPPPQLAQHAHNTKHLD